jgi:hypothetical protein
MPFLIPFLPVIIGGISAGLGIDQAVQGSGQASAGAQANVDIAQKELADKQKVFDQIFPFFQQYLGKGSPFLSDIQSQTASTNAQGYNNAAGQVRQTMQTTGTGYGPSGATGAAIGELGAQEANQSASSYLTNLLNNENLKFTAANGLSDAGKMMSTQNTVGQPPAPTANTTGSSVSQLGNWLNGLLKKVNAGAGGGGGGGTVGDNTGTIPSPGGTVFNPGGVGGIPV